MSTPDRRIFTVSNENLSSAKGCCANYTNLVLIFPRELFRAGVSEMWIADPYSNSAAVGNAIRNSATTFRKFFPLRATVDTSQTVDPPAPARPENIQRNFNPTSLESTSASATTTDEHARYYPLYELLKLYQLYYLCTILIPVSACSSRPLEFLSVAILSSSNFPPPVRAP